MSQPVNEKLDMIRHSTSHVMAYAVKELFPGVKFAIGPTIADGFYYDFDLGDKTFTPDDLKKIEKKMDEIIRKKNEFSKSETGIDEALQKMADQPYKQELITDLAKAGETKVSFFKVGEFEDLCRGPHVESTKELGHFKLLSIAGAYWRGSEKNKMLQRIYGTAFATKDELTEFVKMREEAEKRDHKKLGKELELFMFHETAPGMPYWLPKGLIIYNELVNYWRVEHQKLGYQEICSPLVNKAELWKISGHWDHYKDDMFIADMGENEVYGIKPMNCPNAMVVFQSRQVSYKDLPLRLSDTDRLHRYERSGTLNGLLRVRSFQQDDSHNFISEDMISSEYEHIFQICKDFYGIFGLEYSFRLGTRPESFLGEVAVWDKAEDELKKILAQSGKKYIVAEGDGAFYGPKIDILMKDCLGRDWQLGTLQLDFQLPRRFNLEYTDQDGQKKTPVVVHRVIYGSLERFIGILIEHLAGAFPIWLAPVQAVIIPVSEKFNDYGKEVKQMLSSANIRVELNDNDESLGKRVRNAEKQKVPYILVIGEKEMEAKTVAIRKRGEGDMGTKQVEEFISDIKKEIKDKK